MVCLNILLWIDGQQRQEIYSDCVEIQEKSKKKKEKKKFKKREKKNAREHEYEFAQ